MPSATIAGVQRHLDVSEFSPDKQVYPSGSESVEHAFAVPTMGRREVRIRNSLVWAR